MYKKIFAIIIICMVVGFVIYYKKEKFTILPPQYTADDALVSIQNSPTPTFTNNLPIVDKDSIPIHVSPTFAARIPHLPNRNDILIIDVTDLFNGQAYTQYSNLMKFWPPVLESVSQLPVVTPAPAGRGQVVPYQVNRILINLNDSSNNQYTFDCLTKAQYALIKTLLFKDGAQPIDAIETQNESIWNARAILYAQQDLANYNHGYNAGYNAGLANSCVNGVPSSGIESSLNTYLGYVGAAAGVYGSLSGEDGGEAGALVAGLVGGATVNSFFN
jgi:hypothetical protein